MRPSCGGAQAATSPSASIRWLGAPLVPIRHSVASTGRRRTSHARTQFGGGGSPSGTGGRLLHADQIVWRKSEIDGVAGIGGVAMAARVIMRRSAIILLLQHEVRLGQASDEGRPASLPTPARVAAIGIDQPTAQRWLITLVRPYRRAAGPAKVVSGIREGAPRHSPIRAVGRHSGDDLRRHCVRRPDRVRPPEIRSRRARLRSTGIIAAATAAVAAVARSRRCRSALVISPRSTGP